MSSVGDEVRSARRKQGLSIRALAARAGVSPSTVWRIESGQLDPTVGMRDRVLAAAGAAAGTGSLPGREAAVSLALGRHTAAALLRDPAILDRARRRVDERLRSGELTPAARTWTTQWQAILEGPLEGVVAALIDPSEVGYELRSHTPFTGVLAAEDRLAAVRAASREQRASRSA